MLSIQQTAGRARGTPAWKCPAFNLFRSGYLIALSTAPVVPETRAGQENRIKGVAMFGITIETLRQFSLGEILLLVAMNLEANRLAAENRARLTTGTALSS